MPNDAFEIRRVAVIGAGINGRRLASVFASAGYHTVLEDIMPSNLRTAAGELEHIGLDGVRFASNIEDAVRDADLVFDTVPDELESKLEIFSLLDRMAPPRAIFVTPTRNLGIADLASCTYRPDRCLAVKYKHESSKIELVSTSHTSPQVLRAVEAFWKSAGFLVHPVLEGPAGFLVEGDQLGHGCRSSVVTCGWQLLAL